MQPFWMDIELERSGESVRVAARGCRGEQSKPHLFGPDRTIEQLQAFIGKVGRAVSLGEVLSPALLAEAQALHSAIFTGEVRDLYVRLREASGSEPLLLRLVIRDGALQAFPWEALLEPETREGFLAVSPKVHVARGVASNVPWQPREVRGAVRVLPIVPGDDAGALARLESSLRSSIEAGEVEMLEPITGPAARQQYLFERLRRGPNPHVIHFIGHGGVDSRGDPVLRLTDEDGEESWLRVELLAMELNAGFSNDLRLIYLESCEGARPGTLASAAEILARSGADAIVAHLWPVRMDTARASASDFYRSLTGAAQGRGDVAAVLNAVRRGLLATGAESFSPVLYLRGPRSALFDFQGRKIRPPKKPGIPGAATAPGADLAALTLDPALRRLLDGKFSLLVGDEGEDLLLARAELRSTLLKELAKAGDSPESNMPLSALAQRFALRFGQSSLSSKFQSIYMRLLRGAELPTPPLVAALARHVGPGVHVTLSYMPIVEHAIALHHPARTIHVVQPPATSSEEPMIITRLSGASGWEMPTSAPEQLDLTRETLILRLYGGYSPGEDPILTAPRLTEDDYLQSLLGLESVLPPDFADDILASVRSTPILFAGFSSLDWRHRMLLRWLFDQRSPKTGSVALLPPTADRAEKEIWEKRCAGISAKGSIGVVSAALDRLAKALAAAEVAEHARP